MNIKTVNFIRNFSYTLSSNLITMLISTIVILLVPKLIGVEAYGYWQIYLFYSAYVGFLHFGWNDGIYLRYGGQDYDKLDKRVFFSQFWLLTLIQIVFALLLILISYFTLQDNNRLIIIKLTAVCMVLVNTRLMLIYLLQITNRVKEYAQIILMEKIIYCVLILILLLIGVKEFQFLIISDILGKFIALLYAIYCCRTIVINKISVLKFDIYETFKNISVGIKLMFANIASMFIIGTVRLGIERNWDVVTFGKLSLVLNISNLLMIFINAAGVIMFPVLKRINENRLPDIYIMTRTLLMVSLLSLLVLYYPLYILLTAWLPAYNDSLIYMSILFPMCVFEGKMALLINTYYKALRKEKIMLIINLVIVALSIVFTIISTLILKNLTLAILSIIILLALRSIAFEFILSKIMKISLTKDICLELIIISSFIFISWFFNSVNGLLLYLIVIFIYIFSTKKDVGLSLNNVKKIMRD
ncbi:oligosaccharide flippase family protein [Planococcus halotolerans]|nr:oligosaccharide flippase family protein [Planococcus halotolerans]